MTTLRFLLLTAFSLSVYAQLHRFVRFCAVGSPKSPDSAVLQVRN